LRDFGDASEDVGKPGLWIDVAELGGDGQRSYHGRPRVNSHVNLLNQHLFSIVVDIHRYRIGSILTDFVQSWFALQNGV
jgi:hypothetical protein